MARRQAPVGAPKPDVAAQDHRERLERLRDRLAEAIEDAGARDLAPLAGRYQAILAELAALPTVTEVDVVDALAARRAARRSSAKTA